VKHVHKRKTTTVRIYRVAQNSKPLPNY